MHETGVLEWDRREGGLVSPFHRAITFSQEGLVLGRGTLLAEFENERLAARGLASMATRRASFPF
jgi:hypothetical protein